MANNIYQKSRPPISITKIWLAVGFALTTILVTTPGAQAHATLVRSDPANSAILPDPPPEVRLWFSESISAEFSTAQILDAKGQAIQPTNIQVDPTDPRLMILTLPELAPGLYSIRWKVLSESDGHFTQGPIVFGVGQGVQMSAASSQPAPELPLPEVALRWFNFSALMGLVGAVAIAFLVLKPGLLPHNFYHATRQRVLRWAGWWAGLALLAGVGLLVWQVITVLQTLPDGVSTWKVTWQVLSRTRWGLLWLARQSLLLIIWAVLFRVSHPATGFISYWWRVLLVPLLAGLVAIQSLVGHAAATAPHTALVVVADMLHIIAASLWVGGLTALCVGLLPVLRQNKTQFTTLVQNGWRPFSSLAALSVSLLLATGLYNTGRQVASVDALISTLYGQALLGKIGLMLLIGAIGLLNAVLLHPGLAAPLARVLRRPAGWTPLKLQHLPRLVVIEAGLGLLVVLITGMVTALPQARGPEFEINPDDIPTALSQTVDDMIITFSASPNRPGQNLMTIRAASIRRPPPAEMLRLILRFTFLGQEMGRTSADAIELEPGLYQLGGSHLSLPGPWQVQVIARRAGIEDSVATFHWTVAPPANPYPTIISKQSLELPLTLAAVIMLVISLAVIVTQNTPYQPAIFSSKKHRKDENDVPFYKNEQAQITHRTVWRNFTGRLRKQQPTGKYDILG